MCIHCCHTSDGMCDTGLDHRLGSLFDKPSDEIYNKNVGSGSTKSDSFRLMPGWSVIVVQEQS